MLAGQTCRLLADGFKPRRHPAARTRNLRNSIGCVTVAVERWSFPAQETVKGMGILSVHMTLAKIGKLTP